MHYLFIQYNDRTMSTQHRNDETIKSHN